MDNAQVEKVAEAVWRRLRHGAGGSWWEGQERTVKVVVGETILELAECGEVTVDGWDVEVREKS